MSEIRRNAGDALKPLPSWVAPALVAMIGWTAGVHQPGPLSVYPADRPLPFLWYVFEQTVAVGITVGALAAGALLLRGRIPSATFAYRLACEARYPLALAAALSSRTVGHTIFSTTAGDLTKGKLAVQMSALQWAWLVVMVLAVASLLFQAALKYLKLLSLVVPGSLRPALALLVAVIIGETTAQMLSPRLMNALFWPP